MKNEMKQKNEQSKIFMIKKIKYNVKKYQAINRKKRN